MKLSEGQTGDAGEAIRLAALFERLAIDHEPYGWPAIQQHRLSRAAALLRAQAATVAGLRADVAELRQIVASCAIAAGGVVSPACSMALLRDVPKEVEHTAKRAEAAEGLLREIKPGLDHITYSEAQEYWGDHRAAEKFSDRIQALSKASPSTKAD